MTYSVIDITVEWLAIYEMVAFRLHLHSVSVQFVVEPKVSVDCLHVSPTCKYVNVYGSWGS